VVPVAMILPFFIAIACTVRNALSTVYILPLITRVSTRCGKWQEHIKKKLKDEKKRKLYLEIKAEIIKNIWFY
jgi:hypothetical protein